MEYKINPENLNRIQSSIERIQNNIDYLDLNLVPIIIADIPNAKEIYPNNIIFEKAYNTSFGAVKGNITYEDLQYHLVVLNLNFVELFRLTDEELDGIVSHELGHIFNKYEFENVPTHLDVIQGTATLQDITRIKLSNANNNEFYADYFSKITLNSDGLISSIIKYTQSDFCTNEELFQLRINELNSDRGHIGIIHII